MFRALLCIVRGQYSQCLLLSLLVFHSIADDYKILERNLSNAIGDSVIAKIHNRRFRSFNETTFNEKNPIYFCLVCLRGADIYVLISNTVNT